MFRNHPESCVQTMLCCAFPQMDRQPKWKHVLIKSWKVFAWVCMDVSLYTFEFAFNILYFINRKELNLETVLVGSVALTSFYSCPVSEVSGTCLTRTTPEDLLAQQVWKISLITNWSKSDGVAGGCQILHHHLPLPHQGHLVYQPLLFSSQDQIHPTL